MLLFLLRYALQCTRYYTSSGCDSHCVQFSRARLCKPALCGKHGVVRIRFCTPDLQAVESILMVKYRSIPVGSICISNSLARECLRCACPTCLDRGCVKCRCPLVTFQALALTRLMIITIRACWRSFSTGKSYFNARSCSSPTKRCPRFLTLRLWRRMSRISRDTLSVLT